MPCRLQQRGSVAVSAIPVSRFEQADFQHQPGQCALVVVGDVLLQKLQKRCIDASDFSLSSLWRFASSGMRLDGT